MINCFFPLLANFDEIARSDDSLHAITIARTDERTEMSNSTLISCKMFALLMMLN